MEEREEQSNPRAVRELERGGEIRARWAWVKAPIWTERMLEALERGVKGGKWHSLIDKVYREENLRDAWHQVEEKQGGGGVDKMTIAEFERHLDRRLETLERELCEGTYEPKPVRRAWIPKLGKGRRPLGIPTVRDRVVQAALRNVIEPIFERKFAEESYGFRPGRGCKDALREVDRLLKAGHTWVVDVDIQSYFDSIPKDKLMQEVAQEIADGSVLDLIEKFLHQGVLEEMRLWQPETGTPQGAVMSPLLANIYLHPVDIEIREAGYRMTRYADDMVILCQTQQEAERALQTIAEALARRGLQLHPDKTKIVDATNRPGFQFLGYMFFENRRYPRRPSQKKLREQIRARTKRGRPDDLDTIIRNINSVLRGWFGYFKHSSSHAFEELDGWVRFRLRAILSHRQGTSGTAGRGRGHDHYRWPNAYFREHGLFIMAEAHALARQSRSRVTH